MIPNTNKLTLWTIITNAFILIGAGHGVGPLLLIEVAMFVNPHPLIFTLSESYANLLPAASLFALLGQVFLLVSIALEKYFELAFKAIGLVLLYLSVFYLGANCFRDSLSQFSLFFSIPFVVLSVILLVKQFRLEREETIVDGQ